MKPTTCFLFFVLIQSSVYAQWSQTSGPSGGGVSDFAFTDNKILAATFDLGNGVYASTDSGTSWHESGLQGVMLGHISAKGNTVITSSTQNSYNETEDIYRSGDGGASWQKVLSIPNINGIRSICYHNHQWFLTSQGQGGGMYVSNDDGINWTPFKPAFKFSHPVILVSAGASLFAGTYKDGHIGIFRSTDGATWTESTFGIDTSVNSEIYCGAISGNTIIFGILGSVIYSKDAGISWTEPAIPNLKDKSEYINHITGSGSYFIANSSLNNIYASHDAAQSWTKLSGNGLPKHASYFFSVGFDGNRGMLYLGSSSGILRQSIFSNKWEYSTDGLQAASVADVTVHDGKIFAITERGVSYSSDLGSSWHDPKNLTDLNDVVISGFLKGSNNFYAFGEELYIWNGSNWNWVDTGRFISLAEGASGKLFASRQSSDPISGTGGIDISDNGGAAWGNALTFTNSFDTEFYFLPHCLSSNGSGVILAVQRALLFQTFSSEYTVYRSSDNGFSWQRAVSVNSPTFVTFADNAFYMGTYGSGLFRSVDNGLTWVRFSNLSPGIDVTSFLKISGTMFISVTGNGSTQDGLYFSTDDGISWKYGNNNTANISGPLATDGTFLYSSGPSVWRRPLEGLGVHDMTVAKAIIPLELFPNPAGDVIHIHVSSSQPVEGMLIIYDEKGMTVSKQEVYAESNAEDISLSLARISEGVYYVKFVDNSGNEIEAARFVVQKK